MSRFRLHIAVSAVGLALLTGSAFADSIDGNWCHSDGRRLTIRGPGIVTSGGKQMEGNYSRHAFSYMAPAPERGAGHTVDMTLADENTVYLRHGQTETAHETWVRCSPSISRLERSPPA